MVRCRQHGRFHVSIVPRFDTRALLFVPGRGAGSLRPGPREAKPTQSWNKHLSRRLWIKGFTPYAGMKNREMNNARRSTGWQQATLPFHAAVAV
jgi:hypothetical protein